MTSVRCIKEKCVAMDRQVRLTLTDPGNGPVHIAFELSDDEVAALESFVSAHRRLSAAKPGREGIPWKVNVSQKTAEGTRVTAELPDEDTLSILLHRLRPFILKNEPGSYDKVMSIIGRHIAQQDVRNLLKQDRRLYDGRGAQNKLRLMSRGMLVNSENTLQDWLNSHEYHSDPDKRDAIAELLDGPLGDLPRALLISMLLDKTCAINNAAGIVGVLLGLVGEYWFDGMSLANVDLPSAELDEAVNA
jgi:hypothetical protein